MVEKLNCIACLFENMFKGRMVEKLDCIAFLFEHMKTNHWFLEVEW